MSTSTLNGEVSENVDSKRRFVGIGIIFGLLAAFFSGLNALLVKLVNLHGVEITFFRVATQFVILLPILFHQRESVDILGPKNLRKVLWLRGFSGSTNLIFLYLAVTNLPLGDAVTITYLSIVLIPFLSKIFLKESLTLLDVIFAVFCLTGVVLIARPTFLFPSVDPKMNTNNIGVAYGLISAGLRAVSVVTLRKVGPKTHPFLNMIYYSACGSVTSFTIMSILQLFQYPCASSLPLIFSIGFIGIFGQFCLTMSTKTERAGTVAILKASQIIMVYAMQVVFLKDNPHPLSLVGAALVLSSSVGIGLRKCFVKKN